ncbi:7778_t:CDS:10, partial [Dentiscutata heterogama]
YASIDASLAGFCMIYALGFVPIVAVLIKDYSVVDTGLKSVEHIKEYVNMPQEPFSVITNTRPPAAWPTDGNIKVFGLTVHYSPNDEPALSDIKFSVKAEEKIGIVGRTGAGKTTLANSFLRLTEATKGRIVIDGIDISSLRLEDLRTRLTIIPQDPILFEGTVRSNLDIREEYNDQDLWESLRRVHLVHFEEVNSQVFIIGPITSLDDPVSEGGSNFSLGERQLICLARTLLRRSKIVIMDEVTDIDIEMTNKIQEIIRNEFQHTTILCISHRFDMIRNFDRILVLDEGRIAEFDTPYNLIKNPDILDEQIEHESEHEVDEERGDQQNQPEMLDQNRYNDDREVQEERQEFATQIVKNLFFIGKCFYYLSPDNENQDNVNNADNYDDDDEKKIYSRLLARFASSNNEEIDYQNKHCRSGHLHVLAPSYLLFITSPIYRSINNETAKGQDIEVLDLLQKRVGTTQYHNAYNKVRQQMADVRMERKHKRVK